MFWKEGRELKVGGGAKRERKGLACRLPIGSGAVVLWCGTSPGLFCVQLSSAREFGGGAYVRELRCFSESVQSRDPARGTERLPFFLDPVGTIGRTARETRGSSWSGTTPEGLEERSPRGTTRSGKSRLPFLFFCLCVNDCGWRLSSRSRIA